MNQQIQNAARRALCYAANAADLGRKKLTTFKAHQQGSSTRIGRIMLMSEPPDSDADEITDKGYIHQRAALQHRAALVEQFYVDPPAVGDLAVTDPEPLLEARGFFTVDQVKLEYLRIVPGGSAGPTLVLLHEGLGCLALWKAFPQQLARRTGCSVLVYSRAGYGGSDPCALPRPITFMHAEALQVLPRILDAAQVNQALLVGHSDGASIALIAAGGAKDPRIQGLVLMAPHVFVEELTLKSIRAAAQAYADGDLRRRLGPYHGSNVDCAFKGWSGVWLDAEFARWNIEACLARIKIPILCIQGKEDNYGTLRQLDKISAGLPRPPDILLLPDCGHSPFRDQTTATLEAIEHFVR